MQQPRLMQAKATRERQTLIMSIVRRAFDHHEQNHMRECSSPRSQRT
jgi:hypothetical protein